MGDLVQAYGLGYANDSPSQKASFRELPNGLLPQKVKDNGRILHDVHATVENIHHSLCDLLQAGLISKVHMSHFHTEADNRTEAERLTPLTGEYKGQTKREREAMWEQAVQEKLNGWKYGTVGEARDIAALKKGAKRPLEYSQELASNKRLKVDLTSGKGVIPLVGEDYQNSIAHSGYLKV